MIETPHPIGAISASEDGQMLYTVDGLTGEVDYYSSRPGGRLSRLGRAPGSVRGPRGSTAVAGEGGDVTILDAAGRLPQILRPGRPTR